MSANFIIMSAKFSVFLVNADFCERRERNRKGEKSERVKLVLNVCEIRGGNEKQSSKGEREGERKREKEKQKEKIEGKK